MTDQIEEETKITQNQEPAEDQPKTPTMSTTTETLEQSTKKLEKMNISFSIWPPTQRTREAVINRLIETLSAPSVLSKRYGTIPKDDASEIARRIEEEAFSGASASVTEDGDGIEILQVYSREISKRMLDSVKARSASTGSENDNVSSQNQEEVEVAADNTTASEEISSVETES